MSRLRANLITNENANGAPDFPHGLTVTGIVTATTTIVTTPKIVVGSAVTANSQGIDVTGIVTATSFRGSGSGLTGIDATKIITGNTEVQTNASRVDTKVSNVGILTATSAGANVTGIVTANSFVAGGNAVETFSEGSIISMTGGNASGFNVDTIASTTRKIDIYIFGYSMTNTDNIRIQLRSSAGTKTSGYSATGGYVSNASYMNDVASTTGFDSYGLGSAGYTWSAHLKLKNYKDNYWFLNGDLWWESGSTHYWMHGHVNLGAQITGVRFDSTGSGTFDAGELRVNQYSTP